MKDGRLSFVDLETTGLDPWNHEIIEIGIVLAEQRTNETGTRSIEKLSEHVIRLIPEHIETADPKALEIIKYHSRDRSDAVPQDEGLRKAVELISGTIFIAQNVTADWTFLAKACHERGIDIDSAVHYHRLDVPSMAFGKFYHDPGLNKMSLLELTEYFGVENNDAHSALSDTRATFEVVRKLLDT